MEQNNMQAQVGGESTVPVEADAGEDGDGVTPEIRVAELESKLAEAFAMAERLKEDWLRAKAEAENIRRRAQEDVTKAHKYSTESFAAELLAVKDSLDAAMTVENTSVESFKQGVELTARQLDAVFERFAIQVLDPAGQKFDPHRHQAISQVESEQEPNTVATVLQKGYTLHDRVLRPALVTVAKAKTAPEA
jgi:molecular chaperone GrpE